MAVLIEELLEVWREAERVAEELPPATPERAQLETQLAELRAIHQRLTQRDIERTAQVIAASQDTIDCARRTIERAHERLERGEAPDS